MHTHRRAAARTIALAGVSLAAALVAAATAEATPVVSFTTPAADAPLPADQPSQVAVDATDTSGVAQVAFYADDRLLCVDTTAPFACGFEPALSDIGKTTLVATARGGNGATATAVRTVEVGRATPTGLLMSPSVVARSKAGWTVATAGQLLMANANSARFCTEGGVVTVKYQYGRKARYQTAPLRADCTYASAPLPLARAAFSARRRLLVRASFLGSRAITGTTVFTRTLRLR